MLIHLPLSGPPTRLARHDFASEAQWTKYGRGLAALRALVAEEHAKAEANGQLHAERGSLEAELHKSMDPAGRGDLLAA